MTLKSEEHSILDTEWIHLMLLAKQMGLTVAEIRRYLQECVNSPVSTTKT